MRKHKRAKLFRYILIVAWSVLFGCLVGEVALRVEHERGLRAGLRYEATHGNIFSSVATAQGFGDGLWEEPWQRYKPNASLRTVVNGQEYVVVMNSHGFRTPEFTKEKPDGVFRVVCIGGSTTVQGRTNETTYPALLQEKLNAGNLPTRVEVLNLGISGTPSDYWVGRAAELFSFHPDMIIQYAGGNDICWAHFGAFASQHRLRRMLNHSLLYQRLFPLDSQEFDYLLFETLRSFRQIADEAARRGVVYVFATFAGPDVDRLGGLEFGHYLDLDVTRAWGQKLGLTRYCDYWFVLARYNGLAREFADVYGIHCVDVGEAVSDPDLFIDICHMTSAGVDRMAEVFSRGVAPVVDQPVRNGQAGGEL